MTWSEVFFLLLAMLGLGWGSTNVYRSIILLARSDGEEGRWLIGGGLFQIALSIWILLKLAEVA